ncbi:MAG: hypothetical protein WC370_10480 [Dehalococcoidales bacterium]|jgi:hypothetical protein
MMKKYLKQIAAALASGEKGQALILVLVFVLLGSLTILPTLAHMSTTLKTGVTYENKTSELYTADAGIENGLWRIKYDMLGPTYEVYDYSTVWTFETDAVNNRTAEVSIQNVWIPSNVTLSSLGLTAEQTKNMVNSEKLVVTGTSGAIPGNPYHIKVEFKPDTGDNLTVKSVGVWLPQDFTYTPNSCELEQVDLFEPCRPDAVSVSEVPGGEAVVWSYNPPYPALTSFPNYVSENGTVTSTIAFSYSPPAAAPNKLPLAVAWVTTDGVSGVPVAWDTDARFYEINSASGKTQIQTYSSKSQLRKLGDAISGDYVAIGNSLLADDNHDNFRETWHTPSSFNLNSIPANADVAYAFLYWSGWRNDAAKQNVYSDSCSDFDDWVRSHEDESQTRYPTGDISPRSGTWDKTTNMYSYVDEEVTDGDSTYLLHGTSSGYALFSFPAFSVPQGSAIQDLTVYLVARDDPSGTNKMQPAIRAGGTNYLTTSVSTEVPGSYGTISYSYTVNPRTGNPWTADEINGIGSDALQGIGVRSADANPQIRLTQVYAVVNYCQSRWSISSDKFREQGVASAAAAQRTLTLENSLDLHTYAPTTLELTWYQNTSGTLESDDALYFALSNDGGTTWSNNIEAMRDDHATSSAYWYALPDEYLTSNFKIRYYSSLDDPSEFVYVDNIAVVYMAADTAITFKIGSDQVYFDGSVPASGASPLYAGRSYTMFDTMNGVPEGYSYACVKDVSALVKKYPEVLGEEHHTGNALYTVDGVAADRYKSGTTLSNFAYSGWSLIVIYTCPETAGHYIYIRDDNFAFHPGTGGDLDFDEDPTYPGGMITNFIVPNPIKDKFGVVTETVAAKLTCFVVEGDNFGTSSMVVTGEQSGESITLWNPSSPSPDVINGKSYPGTFNEGVDIDTFEIKWDDGILMPKDKKLYVDMYSNADAWNLVYFILSVRSETVTGGTENYVITGIQIE